MPLDWTQPECWPAQIRDSELPADFRDELRRNDVKEASYAIVKVPLKGLIVPELDLSDDRHNDTDTGEPIDYMGPLIEAMRQGRPFPPILVDTSDETCTDETPWGYPDDGRHRLNAAQALGLRWIPAIDLNSPKKCVRR